MSESMSGPWIRDYFVDIAETHGAHLYDATAAPKSKKKVQLIDFLTYHENSYVWAWVSDKDFRVSARISKDAVDQYKNKLGRSIIDCRYSLIFISNYRPMFSPRPLGPKSSGNTPISHISLEIGTVSFLGFGAHVFGNPRDLESDEKLKEWVLGLRQDGGGGNILKLRKQQILEQNEKVPSPLPPPPPPMYAPVSQYQTTAIREVSTRPEGERPQNFLRLYSKRWRKVVHDRWKFIAKPEEQSEEAGSSLPLAVSCLENANRLEPCIIEPSILPPCTPLHASSQRQGTPTDWSPSNRGSPIIRDEADAVAHANANEDHDEPEVTPAISQIPSGAEGHTIVTRLTSDTRSLPPPTPAQRIKPLAFHSSSPHRSSPLPVQQLPSPTPPSPCSSLPFLPSSFPEQIGGRRTIQRKVPHPGLSVPRPDPIKQGPVQILVPNSDTSSTGFSQSYSQSRLSQSQQNERRLLSHLPSLPSSLAQEFKPADSSTPREGQPENSATSDMSTMNSQPLPTCGDVDERAIDPVDDKRGPESANVKSRKQEGSRSTRSPALSARRTEVLEVGTSDTEEETEELDLTYSSTRTMAEFVARNEAQDTVKGSSNKHDRISVTGTNKRFPPQNTTCTSYSAAASVITDPSTNTHSTNDIPTQVSSRSPERSGSQSSMFSLFSDSLANGPTPSSHGPIHLIGRTADAAREIPRPVQVPRHDPEAWKEPSFITKNKGKGRATDESKTSSVVAGKKRQLSVHPETPVLKRVAPRETKTGPVVSDRTPEILDHARQDTGTFNLGKIVIDNGSSCSPMRSTKATTPSRAVRSTKPRLAKFAVCFDEISLDGSVPFPKLDLEDCGFPLLRTGWIRRQGEGAEKDGSAYIEEIEEMW